MREPMDHVTRSGSLSRLLARQRWLVLPAVALALFVALVSSIESDVPAPRVGTHMVQYLRIGQLQADVRTLVATIQYILAPEAEPRPVNTWSNLPVAAIAMPTRPPS